MTWAGFNLDRRSGTRSAEYFGVRWLKKSRINAGLKITVAKGGRAHSGGHDSQGEWKKAAFSASVGLAIVCIP